MSDDLSRNEGESGGPSLVKTADESAGLPDEVLLSRLESLIFAYPEPISVRRLGRILSLKGKRVRQLLEQLGDHYRDRGIVLEGISGGFQFRTHPANADVVRAALKVKPLRISRPALETLAIVAYRQPVIRAEVEDVRRVDCGGTLRFLFEKGLIRVLGRKEEPGRPIIYGTSDAFLELFGLKSLDDLPSLREFTELWEEHRELVEEMEPEQQEELPDDLKSYVEETSDDTDGEPESDPDADFAETATDAEAETEAEQEPEQ